ncbi:hypothetical protein [Carp edema virus]|nr:hypothetical protein [Carp edema virus]
MDVRNLALSQNYFHLKSSFTYVNKYNYNYKLYKGNKKFVQLMDSPKLTSFKTEFTKYVFIYEYYTELKTTLSDVIFTEELEIYLEEVRKIILTFFDYDITLKEWAEINLDLYLDPTKKLMEEDMLSNGLFMHSFQLLSALKKEQVKDRIKNIYTKLKNEDDASDFDNIWGFENEVILEEMLKISKSISVLPYNIFLVHLNIFIMIFIPSFFSPIEFRSEIEK